jgi:hypothetical protein
MTAQLCPNCHYIYHLIGSAKSGNKESQELLKPIMHARDLSDRYFMPLLTLHDEASKIDEATQRCTDLMVKDWEAIQVRIASGESVDHVTVEYWRKAGINWFEPANQNG